MKTPELNWLLKDLETFHKRFHPFFERSEPREQGMKYIAGLITSQERRNGWGIAQSIGDLNPDKTQRLLNRTHMDREGIEREYFQICKEEFGSRNGTFILDETGFLKKGEKSVGVQRQYTGTAGKIENSQVGVFLSYASGENHVFLNRRLYLPKVWCLDLDRRLEARVPDTIKFQTKPQLALDMLKQAVRGEMPGGWVTGDEVYGSSPIFRDGVSGLNLLYVLAIRKNWTVFKAALPENSGRPYLSFWEADKAGSVDWIARNLPARSWRKLTLRAGEKGPISYLWAAVRIRLEIDEKEMWLLIRRSVNDREEMAFYLSNAGSQTTLKTLAHVAANRYTVEQCFEEAKGEVGMDEYEVRRWEAWHRHILFSMIAHLFLAVRKKNAKTLDFHCDNSTIFRPGISKTMVKSFVHAPLDSLHYEKTT